VASLISAALFTSLMRVRRTRNQKIIRPDLNNPKDTFKLQPEACNYFGGLNRD
jgi:hypothetical protein